MASVFRSRGGQGEQFQDQTLHGERGDTVGHAQLGRSPPGHCGHAQIAHDVHLAERPCEPFEQLNPARVRLDRQNVCAYPPEEVAVQLPGGSVRTVDAGQGWPAWRMNMQWSGRFCLLCQGVTGAGGGGASWF
jgi:hypothetical protein